jgi:hypothetical protein
MDSSVVENVLSFEHVEKIWKIAQEKVELGKLPYRTEPKGHDYIYTDPSWWSSGFFPGSLWIIYERVVEHSIYGNNLSKDQLLEYCKTWQAKVESQKHNKCTHDIGFLIMPSFGREYDLERSESSKNVIITAANSLITRWNEKVGLLRSWDSVESKTYKFINKDTDFLVIIDNMMNLDLLYKATELSGDPTYAEIATNHAITTSKHHVRSNYSTYHLVVFDPVSGERKIGLTLEGYDHESTWSQGQAWAFYGYATVYKYTQRREFLELAEKLADYFVSRIEHDGTVYWDFDAPKPTDLDTTAAAIACSGLLLICQLSPHCIDKYREPVNRILRHLAKSGLADKTSDVILDHGAVDNGTLQLDRFVDHGLVFGDYYFLEIGNRLLQLGWNNADNRQDQTS